MAFKPISVCKEIPVKKLGKLIDSFLENSNRVSGFERIFYKWEDIPNTIKAQVTMYNFQLNIDPFTFHKIPLAFYLDDLLDDEERRLMKSFPDLTYNTVSLSLKGHLGYKIERHLIKLKFFKKKYTFRFLLLSLPTTMDEFMFNEELIIIDEFKFDKSNLTKEHKTKLNYFVKFIKRTYNQNSSEKYRPIKKLQIYGATDKVGHDDYNHALAYERGVEVHNYIKNKIKHAKIEHKIEDALGESKPRIDTDEPEGKNRLVVIQFHKHLPVRLSTRDIQKRVQNILATKKDTLNQLYYKQFSGLVSYISDESKDDKYLTVDDILNAGRKKRLGKENNFKHFRQNLMKYYYTKNPSNEALYEFTRQIFDRIQNFVVEAKKLEAKNTMPGVLPGSKHRHLNKWEEKLLVFYNLRAQENNYPNIFECFRD